jgi:hypothetical protein
MNSGRNLSSLRTQIREHHTRAVNCDRASTESRQCETVVARSHNRSPSLIDGGTELAGLAGNDSFCASVL